ncbi:hypothetical protein JXM83_03790 [Candidatus Woesearchaeota archaeon]|nr:hypothetical protein [Candidatus Woesearchaeota archaeon]
MQALCIRCFGKGLCGRPRCPIQAKIAFQKTTTFEKDFQGTSPDVFIGRFGYPNINVGILATKDYSQNDTPTNWGKSKTPIESIIQKRVSLVNSSFNSRIKPTEHQQNRFLETAQEISLSQKETDVEVNLNDRPHFRLSFNQDTMPHGPRELLKKVTTTSNVKVPLSVDKVTSDGDLTSFQGLSILSQKGFDEYYLTKVFSVGNLGLSSERKLVPTRWSITAVDDLLGKVILDKLKDFKENDSFFSFFGGLSGNYYLILFLPGIFSYELFETYLPNTIWNAQEDVSFTTDYEDCFGRKKYAENTSGGYYAARLPILQYFQDNKIQAQVLVLRFITPDYYAPLGVWYCRESVRDSLSQSKIDFSSRELLLSYATKLIQKKFSYSISKILQQSKLLKSTQQTLSKFM